MQQNMIITVFCLTLNIMLVTGSSLSEQVHQTPADMYKNERETAEINCWHSIDSYNRILWYKQTKNGQLQFLGYVVGTSKSPEDGVNVTLGGDANKGQNCTLTIKDLTLKNSAVYFCAASFGTADYQPAYFGQGTKLTVLDSNTAITPPTVEILKPSEKECKSKKEKKKKKTLVCVAKNFYPDHVSVFWQISGEDQTNGVATDEAAQKIGSYYRITSRLRVSAKEWFTPGNNFTCVVRFFDGTVTTNYEAITVNEKAHKIVKTSREKYLSITHNAILTYGVLIAKSCAYGAFAGFLVWKLQSSAKKHH